MIIADQYNSRIVRWKIGGKYGEILAGGNGEGNALNQLYYPAGIVVYYQSVIIAD